MAKKDSNIYYRGQDFWKELRSSATEEMIVSVQNILQKKLPTSYINLLKKSNGGEVKYPYFSIERHGEFSLSSSEILGVGEPGNDDSILDYPPKNEDYELPEETIVLCWLSYPHVALALDYSGGIEEPTVILAYENYPEPDVIYDKWLVATSFENFLKLLYRREKLQPHQIRNEFTKK